MTKYISLNKFALTEQNICAAAGVRHTVASDFANHVTLDNICTPFYNVNAPYFVATDTKTGNTTQMNTVQLAEHHNNFELIEQLHDMGLVKTEATKKQQAFAPAP